MVNASGFSTLSEQIVKIQIPPGKKVAVVHLLVSGIEPEYDVIDGVVELVVSEILDHEFAPALEKSEL